ncbi:hypothetical protein [Gilvibacter sp.]|uniref:hypothetical protein n=1 Tax=Gilvibacter sp. TaxID=2729997 RepID=UPI003F49DCD3
MSKDYQYFHDVLVAWYQGEETGSEIRKKTADFLNLEFYKEDFDLFIDALEVAIDEYNDDFGYEWEEYKEYAKDTAPTVKGLCHNIEQVLLKNLEFDEFLDWATWHNIDCGESTSGVFENDNIEEFCLVFLPKNEELITDDVLKKVLPIIQESHRMNKVEFEKKIKSLL